MIWIRPLALTLELMGLSVLLAALIGIPLAMCLCLADATPAGNHPSPSRRWTFRYWLVRYCLVGLVACLATPLILHAAVWESTAGKFGWMTFSQTAARTYAGFAGRFGGMVACVWIHGMFGSAIVALATWYGTSRVDPALVDQSRLDGGPIWAWLRVRLPIAAPWLITALLGTAMLAATEMTVVDLYGVRTLADEFYLFHAVDPSPAEIMTILVLPTILSIAIGCTWLMGRRRHIETPLLGHGRDATDPQPSNDATSAIVFAASVFAVVCTTLLYAFPLAGLILKVGQQVVVPTNAGGRAFVHWSPQQAADLILHAPGEFSAEYIWTFVLGISTAMCCVPAAWLIASATRPHRRWQATVDLISLLMVLIPGPLVGLAVIWLFQRPIPGFHSLYHHTIVPTVAALSVRALPISYWIMRAGYAGIDQSILDVARLEASWPRRMLSVDRTLLARPLTITFFAAALVSSGDVPATLPVIPPEVVTVGTRLFSLLHSGVRNQESALAFWYVVGVVTIAVSLSLHWKRRPR